MGAIEKAAFGIAIKAKQTTDTLTQNVNTINGNLNNKLDSAQLGVTVAPIDSDGKIPASFIPSVFDSELIDDRVDSLISTNFGISKIYNDQFNSLTLGVNAGSWLNVAASSITDLGSKSSRNINLTGSNITIDSFGSIPTFDNLVFNIRVINNNVTIRHSAAIICPGSINLTLNTGNSFMVSQIAPGIWSILSVLTVIPTDTSVLTTLVNGLTTTFNTHAANTENPHFVTKTQVGLPNVDNTSDINKPISTATQVALNSKLSDIENSVKSINVTALAITPEKINLGDWFAIAGANVTDLGSQASRNIIITGTGLNINSFGSTPTPDNIPFNVRFDGAFTLTNSANLICPNNLSLSVASGNVLQIAQESTGIWRVLSSGVSSGGSGSGDNSQLITTVNNLSSSLNSHTSNIENPHSVTKAQVGLSNVDNTTDSNKPISIATQDALNTKINTSEKGAVNGVAPLDEAGKVPAANLPASSGGGSAVSTTFTPFGNVAATNVQSAIEELDNEKAPLNGTGATGTWPISISGTAAVASQLSSDAQTNTITGAFKPLANVSGDYINNGSFICKSSGTGNANLAGLTFEVAGIYQTKLGIRDDGYFLLGGGSSPERWYVNMGNGDMYAAGNVTAYSDERMKTDWNALATDFLEKIANVKMGTYTRTDSGIRQVGVSAQSLQNVLPEAVLTAADDEHLTVAYGNAALAAVVELAREIVKLKEEINLLKDRLAT